MRKLLLVAFLLAATPAWGAIAWVQTNGTYGAASGSTSHAITVVAPTAGNFMVLGCFGRSDRADYFTGVSQTNITWTQAVEYFDSPNVQGVTIWYAENVAASGGTTVTVNIAASGKIACAVNEYSGCATSSVWDTDFGTASHASGTTPDTCTQSSTCPTACSQDVTEEVIIGVVGNRAVSTYDAPSNGYTERGDVASSAGSPVSVAMEQKIVTATEEAYTSANDATNGVNAGAITRFKVASGTPVSCATALLQRKVVFQ